ncbi:unnamed protein product [Paramecium sonneborni]|uniref:protein-tyrosine-phosphatase n=1 Tax=Paramecium sonneborni TaxID=65129 RepID=A0A8S1L0P6_9CILI|nr:unnamed protein product [Paramecium sonneborni]
MLNQAFLFAVVEERFHKIYQGNVHVLESIQYFKLKNIRTIIVVGEQNHTKFTEYATYHRVDENIGEAIDIFEKTCQLIQNEIKRSSVLVCCQNGLNWSTAILIAYLINTKKWQYEKAFYHLKSLKYVVNPSLALKKQLILFNTKVHNVKNFNNQENNINQSNLIVPSKFQQRIIEQNQKLQYLDDSIQSREERNSTSSNQCDKTPMFYSPKNNNNNANNSNSNSKKKIVGVQSDTKIMKKQSITKLVRHIRNYTFQMDDGNIINNNNNNINNNCNNNNNNVNIIKQNANNFINQPLITNSPKFKDEESPIVKKPIRRRYAHRTKSAING